jgi:DNA-binding beta-propeller fold protein YncE
MKKLRFFGPVTAVLLLLSLMACSSPTSSTSPPTPAGTTVNQPRSEQKGLPFYCPQYVTLDREGNLYVSDYDYWANHSSPFHQRTRIVKLSPTGQFLAEWHPFKPDAEVDGIAVDTQGNIYVTDTPDSTLTKLSPSGQLLATWGMFGHDPGQFLMPLAVATDLEDNLYVADYHNARVQKLSPSGQVLAEYGTTGSQVEQLHYPTGVAVDQRGSVYVADLLEEIGQPGDTRIVKYSSTGKFLSSRGPADLGLGASLLPQNLVVDPQGSIYVRDSSKIGIVKLSPTGKVLARWQAPAIYNFFDVAVDAHGNVYVTLVGKQGGIEKFSPTGKVLSTWSGTCTPRQD